MMIRGGEMVGIEIVQTPLGDAPQKVREQWIGCIIPQVLLVGQSPRYQTTLIDRKVVHCEVFVVDAQRALAILGAKCPTAREWFDTHVTSLNMPKKFTFDAPSSIEVWHPNASHPTLSEFVDTFKTNCQTLSPESIDYELLGRIAMFIGKVRWDDHVLHEPLCLDLIHALVQTYIDAVRKDLEMMTIDQVELITSCREDAYAFLNALAVEVVRYYPDVDKSNIVRPVTFMDEMMHRGLITIKEDTGIVTPTQQGLESFLSAMHSELN